MTEYILFVIKYSLIPSTATFYYLNKIMSARKAYCVAMFIWGSILYFIK